MLSSIKHLKVFIKDPDKKGILKIVKELFIFGWIKKDIPTDYFRKFLYRKNVTDYKNYLTIKQYQNIVHAPNIRFKDISDIMDNKLSFAFHSEKIKLPVPTLTSYNLKNSFYINNSIKKVSTPQELVAFFKSVLNNHKIEKLFLKPLYGGGGKGCILLNKGNLKEQIIEHETTLLNNGYIHQEVIKQHKEISKIFPKSVNAIRIETYMDDNGNTHLLSAIMRFGVGNSIIDNTGAGGFYVATNVETGSLKGNGIQDITKGGAVYSHHPNTNVKIDGFKIPFFNEAIELAKISAKHFPTTLIGWDIGISESGPIIIEANPMPALHATGVAYGGYLKNPFIKKMLNQVKA